MPKTTNNLYEQIIDFDNLWAAYLEARKGKRYKPEVMRFAANLEENLINIHNHLVWGTWKPGEAYEFELRREKRRFVQAPPFEDRVVHHALVRVVEPLFERRFIYHSYACRKDNGAQRAVKAVQGMTRRAHARYDTPYIVKADIAKYFPSILHRVLFDAISRVVECERTKSLWWSATNAYTYTNGRSLPIGALTSQLGANIVLDQVDHAMTDQAGVKNYVRYMDDVVVVAPSKKAARAILITLDDEVSALGLRLNPKTTIFPANRGVDFAGYRIWPHHTLPRKRNIKRARARFRRMADRYAVGEIDLDYIQPRVNSFLAYTKHCNARRTVDGVLNDFKLQRSD